MTDQPTSKRLELAGFAALFVVLIALGAWWSAPPAELLGTAWSHFASQTWITHLSLAGFALGLIGADAVRLIVFGRLMGVGIGFFAALEATIADNFFSWVTPGSALGEPAAAYMLNRHGIELDAALTIAYARFATSFAFIFTLVALLLAAGFGPPMPPAMLAALTTAVGVGALLMLGLLVGAMAPNRATKLIDAIENQLESRTASARVRGWVEQGADTARGSIARLAWMRRHGVGGIAAMTLSHVLYYAAFVGVLCVLAAAFQSGFQTETIPRALIYLGFIYLFPTPGGAGGAEASADLFFEQLLPVGAPFLVVMLFRAATFYLHVVMGFVYLPFRGALTAVLKGERSDD